MILGDIIRRLRNQKKESNAIAAGVQSLLRENLVYNFNKYTDQMCIRDRVLEAEGECTVNGHALDALIQPKMTARYRFKYIYQVADETWVDVIRLRVN